MFGGHIKCDKAAAEVADAIAKSDQYGLH
jgi:hypothetical protein